MNEITAHRDKYMGNLGSTFLLIYILNDEPC